MGNCLIEATAQVIQVEPQKIIDLIGFSGEEVVWEGLQRPYCFRGIHIQEIIDALYKLKYYGILIEKYPRMAPNHEAIPIDGVANPIKRFKSYLERHTGILISHKQSHAWCWCVNNVYKKDFNILCKVDDLITTVDEALLIIKSSE